MSTEKHTYTSKQPRETSRPNSLLATRNELTEERLDPARGGNSTNVAIDAVVFDPTENLATLLKRYRAGEFDITYNVPFDQLGWLRQNMPKELHVAPYAFVYRLAFNTTKPPFNDQRVRQALAMAIDREVLVEKVTAAGDLPAYGFVPDGMAN